MRKAGESAMRRRGNAARVRVRVRRVAHQTVALMLLVSAGALLQSANAAPLDCARVDAGRAAGAATRNEWAQPLEDAQQAANEAEENVQSALEQAYRDALAVLQRYRTVIMALCIPVGAIACFFGYRLLRPFLFLAGFVLGGGACFVAVHALLAPSSAVAWASIVATLLGGLLSGLLAMWLVQLGVFAIGACLGLVLALSLRTVLLNLSETNPELVFYAAAGALAVLFGTLALCLKRPMIVACTAFGGAFGVVYSVGYFAGHFPNFSGAGDDPKSLVGDPWAWAYFAGFAALGTAGCLVQTRVVQRLWASHATLSDEEGVPRASRRSTGSRERRRRGRRPTRGKDKYAASSHALLGERAQGAQPLDIRIVMENPSARAEKPAPASAAQSWDRAPTLVRSEMPPTMMPGEVFFSEETDGTSTAAKQPKPKRGWPKKQRRAQSSAARDDPFAYAADDDDSVEEFRTARYDEFERQASAAVANGHKQ